MPLSSHPVRFVLYCLAQYMQQSHLDTNRLLSDSQ